MLSGGLYVLLYALAAAFAFAFSPRKSMDVLQITLSKIMNIAGRMKITHAILIRAPLDNSVQIAQEQLGISFTEETTKELSAENKILLAEYFLDFAMQASNYALLMSLEAIHAQNDQPTQNP